MEGGTESTRPVFIVSSPRSGSTLLRLLINTHSKIAIPPPGFMFPFIYPFMSSYGDMTQDANFTALIEDVIEFHRAKDWPKRLSVDEIKAAARERSFAGVYTAIHEIWAERHGKTRWGEKTPRNIFWIGEILGCFPDAQFLNIYRDGCDVAVDWMDNLDWPNNIYSTALEWKEHVNAARPWRRKLRSDQWLDIRYEDLVTDPPATLEGVCRYLEIEYEEAMLKYYASEEAADWSQSESCHRFASQPITPDFVGFHKDRLEVEDRQMLAALIGPELEELGYEVVDRPRELTAEQVRTYMGDARTDTIETMKWNIWYKKRREERRRNGMWNDAGETKSFG